MWPFDSSSTKEENNIEIDQHINVIHTKSNCDRGFHPLQIVVKLTINPFLVNDHFPLPKIDDLIMKLAGKKCFTTIDLKGAYQQLAVDEKSQHLLTMNTPFGLFRYRRLPFGISPAPSIFQKAIMMILKGIPVTGYLDDLILAIKTESLCIRGSSIPRSTR